MNKHKIAIIYPMDPVSNKIGGISTFLKNFVKFLPEEFTVKWIGVSINNTVRPIGKWQRIRLGNKEIEFLPVLSVRDANKRTVVPLILKFVLALIKNRVKIKLSIKNYILFFNRIEAVLPYIFCSCRKFLIIHGHTQDLYNQHSEVKWSKFTAIYFALEGYLIRKFDKIYIVREDAVLSYRKRYFDIAERILFLPTWVDGEVFFPYTDEVKLIEKTKFLENKGFFWNSKLILFAGRFEGAKDPLLLIETFNYVVSKLPSARLLLIGFGGLKDKMELLLKKYSIREKAIFLGVLPQNEVAEVMRVSDVLLLTSAFEGMPMCIMEALGCGLPVVTTDVGEVKRVVKDGMSGRVILQREADIIGEAVIETIARGLYKNSAVIRSCVKDYFAREILKQIYQQMERIHKE